MLNSSHRSEAFEQTWQWCAIALESTRAQPGALAGVAKALHGERERERACTRHRVAGRYVFEILIDMHGSDVSMFGVVLGLVESVCVCVRL